MTQTLADVDVDRMTSTHCNNTLNFKRNSRERKRVQHINVVIRELKSQLPVEWTSKKMGKLEILQKSTLYIKHLMDVLKEDGSEESEKDVVMATKSSPHRSPSDPLLTNRDCEKEIPCPLPTPIASTVDYKTTAEWNYTDKESACMQQALNKCSTISCERGFCENFRNEGNTSDFISLSPCYSTSFREHSEISSTFW